MRKKKSKIKVVVLNRQKRRANARWARHQAKKKWKMPGKKEYRGWKAYEAEMARQYESLQMTTGAALEYLNGLTSTYTTTSPYTMTTETVTVPPLHVDGVEDTRPTMSSYTTMWVDEATSVQNFRPSGPPLRRSVYRRPGR